MTYFAIVPPSLKHRDLKIAIVFSYGAFRFEAWLAGTNRQVQRKYWDLFRDSQWSEYRVATPAKGVDSIVECNLAEEFDFGDLRLSCRAADISKYRRLLLKLSQLSRLRRTAPGWASALPQREGATEIPNTPLVSRQWLSAYPNNPGVRTLVRLVAAG